MFNLTLYKKEIKGLWKMFAIFAGVLVMYVSVIISMYDPDMQATLNQMAEMMPGLMDAFGFSAEPVGLTGFLSSYLYGFLLIAFPMAFIILCGNRVIAKYVDRGSMVSLLAAPVKRSAVAFTQMKVMGTAIIALIALLFILQIALCEASFPGELEIGALLLMNLSLLCLHMFIGGICFFCSCLFSDTKYSLGFGAGIPALMYIIQMLGNAGAEGAKYLTFFTLYNPDGTAAGETGAVTGSAVLFIGGIALYFGAAAVFTRKDLHI